MIQNVMDWEGERVPQINKIWMLARIENQLKKLWFSRSKLKNITNKTLSKSMVSSLAFFYRFGAGFGGVWGGFWGGVWRLWGVPWAAFGFIFCCLYLECSPKGLLEPPGFDFGSILDGLGGVWGAFWEGFGRVWSIQNCSFFGTRFLISRSGSWCFWRGLGRKQSALR